MSKFLRNYILWSYVCGFYLKYPFGEPNRFYKKLLSFIPRIIHFVWIIWSIYVFWGDFFTKKISPVYLTLGTASIPNLIFILDTDIYAKKLDALLINLFRTEYSLNLFRNEPVCLQMLKRKIRVKLFISVIMINAIYFVRILIYSSTFSLIHDIYRCILMTYKCWAIFFIIIVIEYRNFLISVLNQELGSLHSKQFRANINFSNLIHLLRHIRIFYSKFFQITEMINSQFGWCLVIIFLDNFNLITSTFCFTFMALSGSVHQAEILRNYFFHRKY